MNHILRYTQFNETFYIAHNYIQFTDMYKSFKINYFFTYYQLTQKKNSRHPTSVNMIFGVLMNNLKDTLSTRI